MSTNSLSYTLLSLTTNNLIRSNTSPDLSFLIFYTSDIEYSVFKSLDYIISTWSPLASTNIYLQVYFLL